ncbi:hypothetical protein D5086_014038 [Populus alba]|uniref:Uncharacterized protein n=1 Tax=Populus alba TaxID=43335 RepID=A0ACC4C7V8_POPAL
MLPSPNVSHIFFLTILSLTPPASSSEPPPLPVVMDSYLSVSLPQKTTPLKKMEQAGSVAENGYVFYLQVGCVNLFQLKLQGGASTQLRMVESSMNTPVRINGQTFTSNLVCE